MQSEVHSQKNRRVSSRDLLWVLSPEGFIHSLSNEAAEMTGWSENEAVGKSFHSFVHPQEVPRVRESFAQVIREGTATLESVRCLSKSGSYLTYSLSLVPDIHSGLLVEVLVLGGLAENKLPHQGAPLSQPHRVAQLYSQREKASSAALEAAGLARLTESLVANAPIGFAVLDEELRFICLNQSFAGMTGYSPEQQLGQPFKDMLPKVANFLVPMLRDTLATGHSVIDLEVVLQKGAVGPTRYSQMSFYPIPNGHGGTCGVALMALDITDRKRAEEILKKVSEDLVRSNRALEDFSYIASHDLKEPLRTVSMFVNLLERKYRAVMDSETRDYIGFAVSGAERMHRLVGKIFEYSTSGKPQKAFSEIDCAKVLETILVNLKVAIEESRCRITYDALPTVWGDELLLMQIFQNLLANAMKYRGSAPPEIRISSKKEANAWVFSVTDNGIGIHSKHFTTIFAPFRKLHTQSEYAGSGLGLAICQKNIERHGGQIWVESIEGKGSTFHFTLPVARSEEGLGHGSIT